MLTAERIAEIADAYGYQPSPRESEICFDKADFLNFAHKLLAEVKLQDLLKQEERIIDLHRVSFENTFVQHCTPYRLIFNGNIIAVEYIACISGRCISWDDYYIWKQSIGLDELTEQAQEVKR